MFRFARNFLLRVQSGRHFQHGGVDPLLALVLDLLGGLGRQILRIVKIPGSRRNGEKYLPPPRPSTAGPTLSSICATKPNAEVKAIHLKAMSVILTTQVEIETWLTAPIKDALA